MLPYSLVIDDPEDRMQFEEMVRTYKGLMFKVAHDIVKHEQDAEDAVQNALWAVARNFKTLQGKPEPVVRSYLVISAENHAKNLYNKKKRRREDDKDPDSSKREYHHVTDNTLASCIVELPLDYREVVLLKYFHGYTLRENAEILEISQAKAEKLNQNAKRLLKQMYGMEGVHEL